jgi:polysaccharide export outer membrane protein
MKMFASILVALALLPPAAAAQTPAPDTQKNDAVRPAPYTPDFAIPPGDPAVTPADQEPFNPASYVIGPQDQLTITVVDEPDLTAQYTVDDGGGITFPYVGRVQAAGLTVMAFQDRLRGLLEAGYIKRPQLRVDINQYKSQQVFVMGEVRSPGKITLTGTTMTLLEALAQAGSLTSSASNEVTVIHPTRRSATGEASSSDVEGERIHVNMRDLEAVNSILLRDGDIITVAKAQQFYIQGHVRNSGSFILDGSLSLEQAVALAGGLSDRGTFRGAVASRLVNGKLTEVRLARNDKVLPGDTITIKQRLF